MFFAHFHLVVGTAAVIQHRHTLPSLPASRCSLETMNGKPVPLLAHNTDYVAFACLSRFQASQTNAIRCIRSVKVLCTLFGWVALWMFGIIQANIVIITNNFKLHKRVTRWKIGHYIHFRRKRRRWLMVLQNMPFNEYGFVAKPTESGIDMSICVLV